MSTALVYAVQRFRQRAESLLMLKMLAGEAKGVMAAIGQPPAEWSHQNGPFKFIAADWAVFESFLDSLLELYQAPGLEAMLTSAAVRPLAVIISSTPLAVDDVSNAPTKWDAVFGGYIKPIAKFIRALRYVLNDDRRIVSRILAQDSQKAGPVDEGRSDVPPVSVEALQAYVDMLGLVIGGPVDSEEVAQAIDSACGVFQLRVE